MQKQVKHGYTLISSALTISIDDLKMDRETMNQKIIYKNFRICILLGGLVSMGSMAGCVVITSPTNGNDMNNGSGDGLGDDGKDGVPAGDTLAVELRASNSNPQVGETVTLTCTIINEPSIDNEFADLVFEFQPSDRLVNIDPAFGSAVVLINETDTGIEFVFTCTVTNASMTNLNVTSDPSPPVSIIPTATFPEPRQ